MELGFATPLEKMNLIGARPQHDAFGIENAMLVAPGRPESSIVLQRLARRGRGQMPPLVTTVVDEKAVQLMRQWILSLPSQQNFIKEWTMEDLLPALPRSRSNRSFESGEKVFRDTGCVQCHRFASGGGSVGPDLSGVGRRLSAKDVLESILLPSKVIAEGFATTEIETKSGETITGIVEREDDQNITLRPMVDAEQPVRVAKIQIARRALSKTSNMPAGMANGLTEEQILNLMAYLMADGKSDDAVYLQK
jgi:putative heme-binding domain-containing protein